MKASSHKEIYVNKLNLTNDTVEALKDYCKECGVVTYVGVKNCCSEALNQFIYVDGARSTTIASKCKEFTDRFDFLVDKTASELGILPEIVNLKSFTKLVFNRKENPVEFLYYTHLLMPNLDPYYFSQNMNNLRNAVLVLWDRLSGIKHSSHQSMLYLYSTEGGVGKSVFQNIIEEWANNIGVKVTNTRVPHNQFIGDEFNKNGICILGDIRKDESLNWNKINELIDGSTYVVEQKGRDRYELKCQAFLIGSSNFKPDDENKRRINNSIVRFSSSRLEPISKYPDVFKLNTDGAVDIKYYIPYVTKWILSCPSIDFDYSKYQTLFKSSASDWFEGLDDYDCYVLKKIALLSKRKYGFNEGVSTDYLYYHMNKAVRDDDKETMYLISYNMNVDPSTKFSRKSIIHVLKVLESRKKISFLGNKKGGPYQGEYSLNNISKDADIIIDEKDLIDEYSQALMKLENYEIEKNTVIYVSNQILSERTIEISEECRDFLKTSVVPTRIIQPKPVDYSKMTLEERKQLLGDGT